jgi:hypothetical protein
MDRPEDVAEVPHRVQGQPYATLEHKRRTNRAGTSETVANWFVRLRLKDAGKRRRIAN